MDATKKAVGVARRRAGHGARVAAARLAPARLATGLLAAGLALGLALAGCSGGTAEPAPPQSAGSDAASRAGSAAPTTRPKNFLLLVSDDQGACLSCYGQEEVPSPHIDELAAQGCRFTNAYTPVAVCMPSRAVIYTGLLPHRNGAMGFQPIAEEVPVWGDLLKQHGVFTGLLGKLNVKPRKRFQFDFERMSGPHDEDSWDVAWYVEGLRQFLAQKGDAPFAMVVNFRDPHRPFPSDGAPSGWPGDDARPSDPARVHVPANLVDSPLVRADIAHFHDAIRRMDVAVGALLELLDTTGEAADTLVAFTSDNGEPFPFSKTTLYERGIRMPLIIRWPGVVRAGRVEPGFVDFTDFLPTALDIAGAEAGSWAAMDGHSLLPLLRDEGAPAPHEVIIGSHTDHLHEPAVPARSIRVGNWKYIKNLRPQNRFVNDDMLRSATWGAMLEAAQTDEAIAGLVQRLQYRPAQELFDLSRDPLEMHNLAAQEPQRVAQLRARLDSLLATQRDPLLAEFRGE